MKVQPTTKELIAMLYERLPELFDRAAPVQEPVRECNSVDCQYIDGLGKTDCDWCRPKKPTAPPAAQRQWVGLTDEEIEKVWQRTQANEFHDCVKPFARAIEAKLKEKNT
jgi:hypothetical protein